MAPRHQSHGCQTSLCSRSWGFFAFVVRTLAAEFKYRGANLGNIFILEDWLWLEHFEEWPDAAKFGYTSGTSKFSAEDKTAYSSYPRWHMSWECLGAPQAEPLSCADFRTAYRAHLLVNLLSDGPWRELQSLKVDTLRIPVGYFAFGYASSSGGRNDRRRAVTRQRVEAVESKIKQLARAEEVRRAVFGTLAPGAVRFDDDLAPPTRAEVHRARTAIAVAWRSEGTGGPAAQVEEFSEELRIDTNVLDFPDDRPGKGWRKEIHLRNYDALHSIFDVAEWQAWLKLYIEKARAHGMRVLLDMHALPGSQNGQVHSAAMEAGVPPAPASWVFGWTTFFPVYHRAGVAHRGNLQLGVDAVRRMAEFVQDQGVVQSVVALQVLNEIDFARMERMSNGLAVGDSVVVRWGFDKLVRWRTAQHARTSLRSSTPEKTPWDDHARPYELSSSSDIYSSYRRHVFEFYKQSYEAIEAVFLGSYQPRPLTVFYAWPWEQTYFVNAHGVLGGFFDWFAQNRNNGNIGWDFHFYPNFEDVNLGRAGEWSGRQATASWGGQAYRYGMLHQFCEPHHGGWGAGNAPAVEAHGVRPPFRNKAIVKTKAAKVALSEHIEAIYAKYFADIKRFKQAFPGNQIIVGEFTFARAPAHCPGVMRPLTDYVFRTLRDTLQVDGVFYWASRMLADRRHMDVTLGPYMLWTVEDLALVFDQDPQKSKDEFTKIAWGGGPPSGAGACTSNIQTTVTNNNSCISIIVPKPKNAFYASSIALTNTPPRNERPLLRVHVMKSPAHVDVKRGAGIPNLALCGGESGLRAVQPAKSAASGMPHPVAVIVRNDPRTSGLRGTAAVPPSFLAEIRGQSV